MCDFHDSYFGASYPDACCIDGYLWDLDSCEVPGGPLFSGGDVPCPQCSHPEWLEYFRDEIEMEGYEAAYDGLKREYQYIKPRYEQPEDRASMESWWLHGYDEAVLEMLNGIRR